MEVVVNFNLIGFSFFVFMGGGALSRLVYLLRELLLSQSFLNTICNVLFFF